MNKIIIESNVLKNILEKTMFQILLIKHSQKSENINLTIFLVLKSLL